MRIVFIAPFFNRLHRGIERYTADLSNALSRRGAEVHIIAWPGPNRAIWGKLEEGVKIHTLKLPYYFQSLFAGCFYPLFLRMIKPDIVNFYFTWQGEEIAFRDPFKNWKINCVFHFPAEQMPQRYAVFKASKIMKKADGFISVSNFVAAGVRRVLGVEPTVIFNGVDLRKFNAAGSKRANMRKELGISDDVSVLLTSAALEQRKGIHKVLKALEVFSKKNKKFIYLVAGEGSEKHNLLMQVQTLGLQEQVRFLGVRNDMEALYQAADIFIFLSEGEAFGLAPLEAMASSLPLIISRRKPFDEIVPEEGALWVEDEDFTQVSDAISNLAADQAQRISMGKANRKISEQFSWDRVAARYYEFFEKQIKRKVG